MEWKQEYLAYIQSPEWELKRHQTFELFGRRCFKCRDPHQLHIHHKTYERFKAENPETDLLPLCKPCHKALHQFCKRYGYTVFEGTNQFLRPAPPLTRLARRLRSLLDLHGLMRQHDLSEDDARALIEVGAL